jgi:integrase
MTKRFVEYRRRLGVVRVDEAGSDRVDFHSFRRSVIGVLENARVPQTEVAQVVGHERQGITFGTYNPRGLTLGALKEIVERIGYTGVEA